MINKNQLQSSFQRFLPVTATSSSLTTPAKVTAKMSHPTDGTCPYCSAPMTFTYSCGQKVYICIDDRAVFPLPDDMLTPELL